MLCFIVFVGCCESSGQFCIRPVVFLNIDPYCGKLLRINMSIEITLGLGKKVAQCRSDSSLD